MHINVHLKSQLYTYVYVCPTSEGCLESCTGMQIVHYPPATAAATVASDAFRFRERVGRSTSMDAYILNTHVVGDLCH